MKKFFVSLLCVVMLVCTTMGLSACGNKDKDVPSLSAYEIGHELSVYPTCEFSYKVSDECIVKITSIAITLTKKNEINSGDTLSAPFYPCTFHVTAIGSTEQKFAGRHIYLRLIVDEMYKQSYYYDAIIEDDGSILWEHDQTNWTSATGVYFHELTFEL